MIYLAQMDRLELALLVFCRVVGVIATGPVFQSQRVPWTVKAGFSVLLAVLLVPLAGAVPVLRELPSFALAAGREVLVGVSLGFVANLLFAAVNMAGEMADLQSGFAFAALVDPSSEERTSIISQFQMITAWLIFLVSNGHHVLLAGLARSLALVPVGTAALAAGMPTGVLGLASGMFVAALQIGAPVIGSVLVADLALGMLARTVPQMNLLVIGFPVKMVFAFVILMLSLPCLLAAERSLIPMMDRSLTTVTAYLAGNG